MWKVTRLDMTVHNQGFSHVGFTTDSFLVERLKQYPERFQIEKVSGIEAVRYEIIEGNTFYGLFGIWFKVRTFAEDMETAERLSSVSVNRILKVNNRLQDLL